MNRLLSYDPELEFLNEGNVDRSGEFELEFGADLLEIADERELDGFLADVVAKVAPGGAQLLNGPLGRTLVDALKQAARTVLPIRNTPTHGPTTNALGVTSANDLKSKAAKIFGIELEGLSSEDKEFEVAQQFIRFAVDSIRGATDPEIPGDPQRMVETALARASRRHAPGLLSQDAQNLSSSGRWVRQGNRIIVFNC